ncbi:hypothetical protein CC78DRAFT_184863 [Lojkania enalia]|uniref:Uncharacterized protein n=1 Tax=Lojkania enalia TaxID=147567 RepID=A0A9P4JW73_9PLEO|nr:hypothetical protein CC78DRAFT_184863 [Didymosphaeria enalia]
MFSSLNASLRYSTRRPLRVLDKTPSKTSGLSRLRPSPCSSLERRLHVTPQTSGASLTPTSFVCSSPSLLAIERAETDLNLAVSFKGIDYQLVTRRSITSEFSAQEKKPLVISSSSSYRYLLNNNITTQNNHVEKGKKNLPIAMKYLANFTPFSFLFKLLIGPPPQTL